MMDDPPPEVVQSILRLEARKLAADRLEIKVYQSEDGFAYAYCKSGYAQSRVERLGPWR